MRTVRPIPPGLAPAFGGGEAWAGTSAGAAGVVFVVGADFLAGVVFLAGFELPALVDLTVDSESSMVLPHSRARAWRLKGRQRLLVQRQFGPRPFQRQQAAPAPDRPGSEIADRRQRQRGQDKHTEGKGKGASDSHLAKESHADSSGQEQDC